MTLNFSSNLALLERAARFLVIANEQHQNGNISGETSTSSSVFSNSNSNLDRVKIDPGETDSSQRLVSDHSGGKSGEGRETMDGYELFGIYCKLLPAWMCRLYITVIVKPLHVVKDLGKGMEWNDFGSVDDKRKAKASRESPGNKPGKSGCVSVYSFGVVLYEIIMGRSTIDPSKTFG